MISPDYRQSAGLAVAELFSQSPLFKNNQHFACYLALPEELDTEPLIQKLWEAGKTCYLPLISPEKDDKRLRFARYQKGDPLQANRYQVLEPAIQQEAINLNTLDVILAPLLAFDEQGHRLGTGGGYYDYSFSFLLPMKKHKPLFLGLAYEIQKVEKLNVENFDLPLDGVITEERFLVF